MDELAGVGDPELRAAFRWVVARPRPVTKDELAAGLGIHPNVARSRLERLTAAGLLETGFERRTGRSGPGAGRPAKAYAVLPQLRQIEFPPRHYEALVRQLAAALGGDRDRRLEAVGDEYAGELADAGALQASADPETAREHLREALGRLGFQASIESSPDGSELVVETPACPLRPLVAEDADLAAIDRGMWSGLVRRAAGEGTERSVSCKTHGCLDAGDSCRIVVRLGDAPPSS